MESPDVTTRPNPLLHRRNSIATTVVVPEKLTLPEKPHHAASYPNGSAAAAAASSSTSSSSQSFPSVDLELISIEPLSYTSLKHLLPCNSVQSPTAATPCGGQSGYEISIRNRLVKQAAWAYLRPMSTSPELAGTPHFLHRLWARVSDELLNNPVAAFLRFVTGHITRAFDRLLRAIRVRSSGV